jgi:hypothetical protein
VNPLCPVASPTCRIPNFAVAAAGAPDGDRVHLSVDTPFARYSHFCWLTVSAGMATPFEKVLAATVVQRIREGLGEELGEQQDRSPSSPTPSAPLRRGPPTDTLFGKCLIELVLPAPSYSGHPELATWRCFCSP